MGGRAREKQRQNSSDNQNENKRKLRWELGMHLPHILYYVTTERIAENTSR
jgi:hypothetical protein